MKKTALAGLALGFAFLAVAEHRVRAVGHIPRTYGSRHGFGNVVFPGTGNPPPVIKHPFSVTSPGFAHNLGGIVTGFRPYTGAAAGRRFAPGRSLYVPIAYPVFIGGYYPEPVAQPPANITIVNPPQPAPQIIVISTDRAASVVRQSEPAAEESNVKVYQAPSPQPVEAPNSDQEATVYLIAFKDSAIYPAVGYWVVDDTLHYTTLQGRHNQASLSLIDHELTQRLNRERKVEFRLPVVQ